MWRRRCRRANWPRTAPSAANPVAAATIRLPGPPPVKASEPPTGALAVALGGPAVAVGGSVVALGESVNSGGGLLTGGGEAGGFSLSSVPTTSKLA